MKVNDLLKFVEFTHKLQQVKRVIYVNGEDRDENDSEHSFQLALLAWYFIDSRGLKLNLEKVLQYSLAHDLVEVYAGDTFFYTTNQAEKDSKKEREMEAALKIKDEFSEFPEIFEAIDGYEKMEDEESKFVYALDKILPAMNIYLDGGRTWKREDVTLEMLRTKDEKVRVSKEVENVWKEFMGIVEREGLKLFN